jgi:hypothetical protein
MLISKLLSGYKIPLCRHTYDPSILRETRGGPECVLCYSFVPDAYDR